MGLINPDTSGLVDGGTADAADVTTPLNVVIDEMNGRLDANNLADSAVTSRKAALTMDVNGTAGSKTAYTSSTFAAVTNASITLAPAVTSNVLLTASGRYYIPAAAGAENLQLQLHRDSTAIGTAMVYDSVGSNVAVPFSFTYLDESVAAGSYAYTVQIKSTDNTTQVNVDTVYIVGQVTAA